MKKSQIGIFILIALIIIIALIYLFSSDISQKREEIEQEQNLASSSSNDGLEVIQDTLDYCVARETRRALIIAGSRGGYITDVGDYYTTSVNIDNTYSSQFISNWNLNWNNLFYKTLIWHHNYNYPILPLEEKQRNMLMPDGSGGFLSENYPKSVKEDFEDFILTNVIECMDLDSYLQKGFSINYERFSSNVFEFVDENNQIEAENLQGSIDDEIEVVTDLGTYIGFIDSIEDNLTYINFTVSDFKNIKDTGLAFDELSFVNLNSTLRTQIDFYDDNVVVEFFFPLTISSNNYQTSITSSQTQANVRFKSLARFAKILLDKKNVDKTINLENISVVKEILEEDSYALSEGLEGLDFYNTTIIEEDEEKRIVYSFVDRNSPIYGNPYVFNFAYENQAPQTSFENHPSIKADGNNEESLEKILDQGLLIYTAKNVETQLDLLEYTSDQQIIDDELNIFFREANIDNQRVKFEVTPEGVVTFTPKIESLFSFDIGVSDGELIKEQKFNFVSGFPENINNTDAQNCFVPQPNGNEEFPIKGEFSQINSFTRGDGNEIPYTYAIYNEPAGITTMNVTFALRCMGNLPDIMDFTYTINGGDEIPFTEDTRNLNISLSNGVTTLEVYIYPTETVLPNPYIFEIYTASCLGPYPNSDVNVLNGPGSCCNTQPILDSIDGDSPSNFDNSILEDEYAIDQEIYACYDYIEANYDFENNIFWEDSNFNPDIYKGTLKSYCGGNYPSAYHGDNLQGIESSNPDYSTTIEQLQENNIEGDPTFDLKSIKDIQTCELCFISGGAKVLDGEGNPFSFIIKNNSISEGDIIDSLTVTPDNNRDTLANVGSSSDIVYTDYNYEQNAMLCSNENYYSTNTELETQDWKSYPNYANYWTLRDSDLPIRLPSTQKQGIYVSKAYCSSTSSSVTGFPGCIPRHYTDSSENPTFDKRIAADPNQCTNWQYDNTGFSELNNARWSCGGDVLVDRNCEYLDENLINQTDIFQVGQCNGNTCDRPDSISSSCPSSLEISDGIYSLKNDILD